jgi:ribosome-binding protein aMBF1 (putative translation factor)
MQHIKDYMKKIDAMVASTMKTSKPTKKGLLAPSKDMASSKEKRTELSIVADYVRGIRIAREEMKNGN